MTSRRGSVRIRSYAILGRLSCVHPATTSAPYLAPLLAHVPDAYRMALELNDLGDFTQEQAAPRLALSRSGMKSLVQRGRRMLRDEVTRCCRTELDARGALSDASTRSDSGAC